MLVLTAIWNKISGWVIAIGSIILAFGSAYLFGLFKGKSDGEKDVKKADAKATQESIQLNLDTRQTIDAKIEKLPLPKVTVPDTIKPQEISDAQSITTADPSTAAGQLRDWMPKG